MSALLDASQGGFGGVFALLQALAALALVAALVWFVRRAALGSRLRGRSGQRLQVEERVALDLRNALVIVRVDGRSLLLAIGEHAPARLITELPAFRAADAPSSRPRKDDAAAPQAPHAHAPHAQWTTPPVRGADSTVPDFARPDDERGSTAER